MRPSAPRIGSGPYGFERNQATRVGAAWTSLQVDRPAQRVERRRSRRRPRRLPGRSDSCRRGAWSPATDRTGSGRRVTCFIGGRDPRRTRARRAPTHRRRGRRPWPPSAGNGPTTAASPRGDASRGGAARSQRPCCSSSRSARSAGTSIAERVLAGARLGLGSRELLGGGSPSTRLRSRHDAVRVERRGLDPALLEPVAETPRRDAVVAVVGRDRIEDGPVARLHPALVLDDREARRR